VKLPLKGNHAQALKRFALQILNTTLAVWIALAFEGLVERRRLNNLVTTAAAHMRSEIADNRRDVVKLKGYVESTSGEVTDGLACLNRLLEARAAQLAGKKPAPAKCGIAFHSMRMILGAASRSTAEATGALGHMPYVDAKRFSESYTYQQYFQQNLDRLADHGSVVSGFMRLELQALSLEELREMRAALVAVQRTLADLAGQTRTMLMFFDQALGKTGG
jgi:hypothetical protein